MSAPDHPNPWFNVFLALFRFLRGLLRLRPQRLFLFLRGFFRSLIRQISELVINPQKKFWELAESRPDLQKTEKIRESRLQEEEDLYDDIENLRKTLSGLVEEKLVSDLYIRETRLWMHDILGAKNPEDVYQVIDKRIKNLLDGHYKPLFTPFSIGEPEPSTLAYLKSGQGEMVLESVEKAAVEQILIALPNDDTVALVHLIVTDDGTYGLISQHNRPIEIITCASMTRQKVENLLRGWLWLYYWHSRGMYEETLKIIAQEKIPEREREVFKKAAWRYPYQKIFYSQSVFDNLQPTEVPVTDDMPSVPFPSWILMEVILRELGIGYTNPGEGLWGRLHQRLSERGIRRIILCPDKALALFPHHATILGVDGYGQKNFLLDYYEVGYLPQGELSNITQGQVRPQRILVVGDDNETFSSIAVANLCHLAPEYVVTRPNASNFHILKNALRQVEAFTFVGHAVYDWVQPENSHLRMTNRNMTLKRFLDAVPPHLQMIVLGGCEIGLPMIRADVSDYKGFAEDLLLKSHIPVIISTLWPVHQVSAVLLMQQFHRYLLLGDSENSRQESLPVNIALSSAQKWLRNLTRERLVKELHNLAQSRYAEEVEKEIESVRNQNLEYPYAHPYFWASFYMMGETSQ